MATRLAMSLFPAYLPASSDPQDIEEHSGDAKTSWLENDSFVPGPSNASVEEPTPKRRRRRRRSESSSSRRREKKRKHKKRQPLDNNSEVQDSLFEKDKKGDRSLLYSSCLSNRKVPVFRRRWKHALGGDNYDFGRLASHSQSPRFFQKSFVRSVLKGDAVNLSSYVNKARLPDTSSLKLMFIPFGLDENACEKGIDVKTGDNEFINDVDDNYVIKLSETQEKTRSFNERIRLNPCDVDLWLDYVAFQDEVMEFDESKRNVLLRSKVVVEKKLSVLKAAMDKNPSSHRLAVERLKISKEISDNASLDRQWKELLFMFPGNVEVMREYLTFVSSYFTTFTVSKTVHNFKFCFDKLKAMHVTSSGSQLETVQNEMVNLLARLTRLWSRSGYREKAYGLFQALMELNFCSPEFPGYYSLEDRLATFEQFWESGTPRFGEKSSVGWATAYKRFKTDEAKAPGVVDGEEEEADEAFDNPNNDSIEDQIVRNAKSCATTNKEMLWLRLERSRERRHWRPWRSRDDEPEDPERSVSFEDIQDFLFQFPLSGGGCAKLKLVLCFLSFLGVELSGGVLETQSFNEWLTLFCPENYEGGDDDLQVLGLESTRPDFDDGFLRNVFWQLSKVLREPLRTEVTSLWLRFESGVGSRRRERRKETVKFMRSAMKSMLDQDRENVRLYCAYASFLRDLEGRKSSSKIMTMLLASFPDRIDLQASAIGLELESGNLDEARRLLLSSSSITESNNVAKLHEMLNAEDDRLSNLNVFRNPVTFVHEFLDRLTLQTWSLLLVEENAAGSENACDFLTFVLSKLGEKSPCDLNLRAVIELVHKLRVQVSCFAAGSESGGGRRKLQENAVSSLLADFPSNQFVLNDVLLRGERWFKVEAMNVANSYWRSTSTSLSRVDAPSPSSKLAVVMLLAKRYASAVAAAGEDDAVSLSFLHRVKKLLQNFTAASGGGGGVSPALWRVMIWATNLCCLTRQKEYLKKMSKYEKPTDQLAEVKTILFRALQDNPSAKVLFLDVIRCYCQNSATSAFASDVAASTQKELQDLMMEKEIRVRMPMEELQVILEEEVDGGGDDDDD